MSTASPEPKPRTRTLAQSRRWEFVVAGVLMLAALGVAAWYGWGYYHWRAAQNAHADRDFDSARSHLTACLRVWPNDGQTHLLMARTCRRAGDHDAARISLKQADQAGADTADLDLEYLLLDAETGDILTAQRILHARLKSPDANDLLILEALAKGCLNAHYLPE